MQKLIILRGLPGSGKSYLADEIVDKYTYKFYRGSYGWHWRIRSTDDFWNRNDKYEFRLDLASIAHQWNQSQVAYDMFNAIELIIVDNTNTTLAEMQPYLDLAVKFGYDVKIKEPQTEWAKNPELCWKKNSHGVPLEVIQKMTDRWQKVNIQCC